MEYKIAQHSTCTILYNTFHFRKYIWFSVFISVSIIPHPLATIGCITAHYHSVSHLEQDYFTLQDIHKLLNNFPSQSVNNNYSTSITKRVQFNNSSRFLMPSSHVIPPHSVRKFNVYNASQYVWRRSFHCQITARLVEWCTQTNINGFYIYIQSPWWKVIRHIIDIA